MPFQGGAGSQWLRGVQKPNSSALIQNPSEGRPAPELSVPGLQPLSHVHSSQLPRVYHLRALPNKVAHSFVFS